MAPNELEIQSFVDLIALSSQQVPHARLAAFCHCSYGQRRSRQSLPLRRMAPLAHLHASQWACGTSVIPFDPSCYFGNPCISCCPYPFRTSKLIPRLIRQNWMWMNWDLRSTGELKLGTVVSTDEEANGPLAVVEPKILPSTPCWSGKLNTVNCRMIKSPVDREVAYVPVKRKALQRRQIHLIKKGGYYGMNVKWSMIWYLRTAKLINLC